MPVRAIGYVSLENSDYAEFESRGSFNRCNGIVILPGELMTSSHFSATLGSSTGVLGSAPHREHGGCCSLHIPVSFGT